MIILVSYVILLSFCSIIFFKIQFNFIDDFKIHSICKFAQNKYKDPELYLQSLSKVLKGEHQQQSISNKSPPKQAKCKEVNISNQKKINKFTRRNAKIPSNQIQKITNNLNEIEKKMDSTYGELNDLEFDQDYMNLFKTFNSSKNMIILESDKFEKKTHLLFHFQRQIMISLMNTMSSRVSTMMRRRLHTQILQR